ncbi:MAG: thiolase [Pseudomonadota bacterium]
MGSPKDLRGKTAIVGAATFGCGEAPGFTELELSVQAAIRAVEDAGLSLSDIDGVATCSTANAMYPLDFIEHLGIQPSFIEGTCIGGSSFVEHILPAAMALEAGVCNAVLVSYGSVQRSGEMDRKAMAQARQALMPYSYEAPYQPMMPVSAYALAAQRYMHEYGATREQLAEVAVAARKWAQLNPEAYMREDLTVEDVLNSRMVSSPLTVRDCCLVTDGAGAFVMTRADRAKDLPKKPAYVLGAGAATWHSKIANTPDMTVTSAKQSGEAAYQMAGLGPRDVDVLALYDAFTINTILFLEDLGFCPKGEGGRFVEGGRIAPGGELPVNTNGGGLSCVHPGMYGVFTVIESVRQLRGEGGERQVANPTVALAHGNGGTLSSQCTALLGTEDAL